MSHALNINLNSPRHRPTTPALGVQTNEGTALAASCSLS